MIDTLQSLLVLVKIAILVLGSLVALLAYRAYLRTQIEGLQYFSVGLLIITLGTFLVGILHHVVGVSSIAGILLESFLICFGFIVMIYALYGR